MRQDSHPRIRRLALLLGSLAVASLASGCGSKLPQKTLIWEDTFDGAAGTRPDPRYWDYDVGGGGWGNAQLEFDTARPENVSLDGQGHLAITARKESYQGRDYTSARINTRGRFEQSLGRYEARMKLPSGQGLWPAFWMLGANCGSVGWPTCGEIDIMELRGQEPGVINGSLHAPGYSGGSAITAKALCRAPTCPFDSDFHVYAVEVEADRVTFEVDGVIYQQVQKGLLPTGSAWPYDKPFFLILNVAVGGSYVGAPDVTTVFPQTMLVDWIRVYRFDP